MHAFVPRVLGVVVFAAVALCAGRDSAASEATPPNILLILADDVGREVLGCYGGQSYSTPELDQLADSGMRFSHAYVMAACHPTRVSLLTGQYPFQLGNPEWGTFPAAAESRTFAQVLKNAGYATAVAGKWQIAMLGEDVDQPHRLGFDEYSLFGWHEGPRYYQPHIRQNGRLRDDVADRYGPDVYCEFLIDFMKDHREGPFFAFYSMALCHDVTDDLDQPVPHGPRGRYDNFAEMVTAMDERVGRMVAALDDLGLREETVVIFVADNGTPAKTIVSARNRQFVEQQNFSRFEERLIPGGKAQLTDWGTRVPLIVNWPGRVAEGEVNEALVDATDFLPTLAELAGAELPAEVVLSGHSFAGEFLGGQSTPREWVFAEHKERSFVKDRRWKLDSDGDLYDLDSDPDEEQPIAASQRSAAAQAVYEKLVQAYQSLGISLPR